MNRYWLRIGLGALAVFAVGYAGWRLVERGVGEVRDLAMSDQEISIPLFGALPFTVEGRRVGSLQRLTLLRDAPKQISGVIVRVSGADSLPEGVFESCGFTVQDPTRLNEHTEFRCLRDSTELTGLESFGEVRIETPGGVVVRKIYLPPDVIREFRDPAKYQGHVEAAELGEAEAQRVADSIGVAMEAFGDSIGAAMAVHAESMKAEALRRAAEATARAREASARARQDSRGGSATVEAAP